MFLNMEVKQQSSNQSAKSKVNAWLNRHQSEVKKICVLISMPGGRAKSVHQFVRMDKYQPTISEEDLKNVLK